jgi:hypothetical protein
MRVAREVLRERSLDDARVPRGFGELYRLASEEFPSKEAFRAQLQRINDRNENRVEALLASRARPDRDFEIWENRMDPEMTYTEWVRYRLNTTPEQARQQPLPLDGIDDAYLERLRLGGFLKAREVLFQRWLITTWGPSRGLEARWTDALRTRSSKSSREEARRVSRGSRLPGGHAQPCQSGYPTREGRKARKPATLGLLVLLSSWTAPRRPC